VRPPGLGLSTTLVRHTCDRYIMSVAHGTRKTVCENDGKCHNNDPIHWRDRIHTKQDCAFAGRIRLQDWLGTSESKKQDTASEVPTKRGPPSTPMVLVPETPSPSDKKASNPNRHDAVDAANKQEKSLRVPAINLLDDVEEQEEEDAIFFKRGAEPSMSGRRDTNASEADTPVAQKERSPRKRVHAVSDGDDDDDDDDDMVKKRSKSRNNKRKRILEESDDDEDQEEVKQKQQEPASGKMEEEEDDEEVLTRRQPGRSVKSMKKIVVLDDDDCEDDDVEKKEKDVKKKAVGGDDENARVEVDLTGGPDDDEDDKEQDDEDEEDSEMEEEVQDIVQECENIAGNLSEHLGAMFDNAAKSSKKSASPAKGGRPVKTKKIIEQPKCLGSSELRLKPYQLVGMSWMVLMHNSGTNGILADVRFFRGDFFLCDVLVFFVFVVIKKRSFVVWCCACIHTHIHTHKYAYIHVCIHTYTYTYIHKHTYTCIHKHAQCVLCMENFVVFYACSSSDKFVFVYVCVYTYVCVCMCVCTYIHTCMHTHIQNHARFSAFSMHISTHTYIHTYIPCIHSSGDGPGENHPINRVSRGSERSGTGRPALDRHICKHNIKLDERIWPLAAARESYLLP
jgi:hypothetical protein